MQNTDNSSRIFKFFLWVYALLYILAGFNHFRSPSGYCEIMPKWIPYHLFFVYLSGILEILFGIMLLFKRTRKLAGWFIISMLLAFLPVHIDMIQQAPFLLGTIKITPFIAWVRIPFQLFFMWWAWIYTKKKNDIRK